MDTRPTSLPSLSGCAPPGAADERADPLEGLRRRLARMDTLMSLLEADLDRQRGALAALAAAPDLPGLPVLPPAPAPRPAGSNRPGGGLRPVSSGPASRSGGRGAGRRGGPR
ncbi:conserved hypothetical protein [Frankia canadensis]|uniref:Uncharacterized protein n=1 Tax=Frankia canadensis TaxID=1836972 RepID=A0A2I2KRD6_9ACTN|nr:hypothetical protein [Frankia canadensis]SNQ48233.1 conserved hypothetical protein [Frankia canadensis]SOU55523.1 conserved hypothetical protein [Frankia canadensis]